MLTKLTVTNFALIENAALSFENGFTVITGETGSGKSIMLGALRLILGERADYAVIRNKDKKTVVEAVFDVSKLKLIDFFNQEDLDYQEETIVRREINANGKSRAFINDTPVQLNILKSLADRLIHIHSQHNTINLKSKSFQLSLLDSLGGLVPLKEKLVTSFQTWKTKAKELEALKEEQAKNEREADFNRFLKDELDALVLDQHDYEQLSTDLKRAEQFEELKQLFSGIAEIINGDEGVSARLTSIKRMSKIEDAQLSQLLERIEAARVELDDVADTALSEVMDMDASDVDRVQLTSQLDNYNTLLKKHNCSTQAELSEVYTTIKNALTNTSEGEALIIEKEKEVKIARKIVEDFAEELSSKRKSVLPDIEGAIISKLGQLKLSDTQLHFKLTDSELTETGKDFVQLLFTPNKGMDPQPIEKSASGGELARVMLVLHYLLATKKSLPTVIFDEIDTGVSGEVAQRIAYLLKEMGGFMQLIAITHLPQVAGCGDHQIRVSKTEKNAETITTFDILDVEERIEEVAKLMSGAEVNTAAIENARKLMGLSNN